jgi:hypothetical protein
MKSSAGIDQSHQADPRRGRRVDKADWESAMRTMEADKHAVSGVDRKAVNGRPTSALRWNSVRGPLPARY